VLSKGAADLSIECLSLKVFAGMLKFCGSFDFKLHVESISAFEGNVDVFASQIVVNIP